MKLARIRHDYRRPPLREASAPADPFALFRRWLRAAIRAGLPEPNAMAFATVGRTGPHVRFLLLKGLDARGLVFYTQYASAKGRELALRPVGAGTFWWPGFERQVRFEGRVERVSAAESDAYFAQRPRGAQLGAWVSRQSRTIANRAVLEERRRAVERRFAGRPVPRPEEWGGYRLLPATIEFWQGRPDRLHDRLRYRRVRGVWRRERLSP